MLNGLKNAGFAAGTMRRIPDDRLQLADGKLPGMDSNHE